MCFVYCLLIGSSLPISRAHVAPSTHYLAVFSRRRHRRLPYFRLWTLESTASGRPALECALKEAFDGFIYSLLVPAPLLALAAVTPFQLFV